MTQPPGQGEDWRARALRAEAMLEAIRSGQVDTILDRSGGKPLVVRLAETERALGERMKELSCLCTVARLVAQGQDLPTILQACVDIIGEACQFPDVARVRIRFFGREFRSQCQCDDVCDTCPHDHIEQLILVDDEPAGDIHLCYSEARPAADEGPFLAEERTLLQALADHLGLFAGRERLSEALRENEHRLRSFQQHSPLLISECSLDGRYLHLNDALATFLHSTPEALAGRAFEEIIPADMAALFRERIAAVATAAEAHTVEDRMAGPEGPATFITTIFPLFDAAGEVRSVGAIAHDISDRRRVEEALRRSEEYHRITLESIGDAVIATDAAGRVSMMNAVAEQLTGWPQSEAAGRPLTEVFHIINAETRQRCEDPVAKVLATGRIVGLANHTALIARDGSERQIADSAAPIRPDGSTMIQGVVLVFRDVTEEYQQQEQLRESEERFQKMLSLVPDMISIHDTDMNIVYSNWNGFAAVPEKRRATWTKCYRTYRGLDAICPDCQACEVIANKEPFQREVQLPDGVWIDLRVIPILGSDSEVKLFVEWVRDITARKRAEQEHEELQAQILHTQKMDAIGQLAGGVAHDFNNQLTGVLGFASMLLKRLDDQHLKRYAEQIIASARRSSDLTQKLLAFSRKGQFQRIPVDVHRIINDTVEMLQHSIDKRIRILRHFDAQLARIVGDPSLLQNALLNLAVNARDAMSEGGEMTFTTTVATLEARTIPGFELSSGRYLVVGVEDTGCGMSQEVQAHLFEPFFTTKEAGRGTGMGLASVFGTVKQHQGAITVYSESGLGTIFRLYLPLAEQPVEAECGDTPPRAMRSQLRILVVDDEDFVRDLVDEMLTDAGHRVTCAEDGVRAVERYRQDWPEIDLVILDMIMPGLDGRDTFRAMKAINPAIRAILASGYSLNEQSQAILAEGALGFVQKPFSPDELLRAVECATMEQGGQADSPPE
ncbi:MAG: PAS domain S-box protein [Planctomycetota bacterium]